MRSPVLNYTPREERAVNLKNDRFLRACRKQSVDATPIWIMRQAGRYLPEYRATRAKAGDFLTLCKTPELACEVTLQPVDLFGLDAAILFSDILIPLEAMGVPLTFAEGEGPKLQPVRSSADVARLREPPPGEGVPFVLEAVRLIRGALGGRVPLIGFAGAPFTLASYLVEGGTSKNFRHLLGWMYSDPAGFRDLLGLLARTVTAYLRAQVGSGAQAIQIFDTWAGILSRRNYREFALPPTREVIASVKDLGVPVILYVNGSAPFLEEMGASGADVISVDWRVGLAEAAERTRGATALQGNLDPLTLYAPPDLLEKEVRRILAEAPRPGHIFNLGHGILPDAPVDAVRRLVEIVHRWEIPV
jgi:uroporphyrinogen decarboxylase